MDSPVIIKKSVVGTLISLIGRWKVCVMGDHLSIRAIRSALSACNTGNLRKWPKPMAYKGKYVRTIFRNKMNQQQIKKKEKK